MTKMPLEFFNIFQPLTYFQMTYYFLRPILKDIKIYLNFQIH